MFQFVLKFLSILVFIVVAYNVWLFWRNHRILIFSWKQHGGLMPLLPFIGNTYASLLTGRKVNMISTLCWAERFLGLPVNYWYGHKYHYMCNNAEEARIALNHPKCLDKAELYKDVQTLFGDSLLLVPGEQWKPRRRFIRSAFKPAMIKEFASIFYNQSNTLIDLIKSFDSNTNLYDIFNKHAFINFFLVALGWDSDKLDEDIVRFGHYVDKTQDEFLKLLVNPLMTASVWLRTPTGLMFRKNMKEMKKILKIILKDKLRQKAEAPIYIDDSSQLPLMDLMLSDEYAGKDFDISEEFSLFAAAATETTGHTLAFCFTLLGMYPEIQQYVYDEFMTVVGEGAIDNNNLAKLKYTEAVISETLRILPTIPLYGRYCSEDIDIGTKVLPKGANIFISAYHIHRNPQYWEDPLKFDPNRFLPENISKIVPGSYVPFSAGARNCIGLTMAMAELKITVANVVRHYEISSRHKSVLEFKLTSCISMKTEDRLDCKFTPRVSNGH